MTPESMKYCPSFSYDTVNFFSVAVKMLGFLIFTASGVDNTLIYYGGFAKSSLT